jgi:hypothetical protein
MEVEPITLAEEEKFDAVDRVRLGSVMFCAFAIDAPRLILHRLVRMGDYSEERREDDVDYEDDWTIKTYRRILEKEIGPPKFRWRLADELEEIRKRRGLLTTTPIDEM